MIQTATHTPPRSIGEHVRTWRTRRRLSQLRFAVDAEISQRHLSFIESNRAKPSRDMVLRIAEHLNVPLRDRNAMLFAAGYAPHFQERRLDDPALKDARTAIHQVLKGHEPFPAIAVDRLWTLLDANDAIAPLLSLVADQNLLTPPLNMLRLSLAPGGLAPFILNLAEWRDHIFDRLRRQIEISNDSGLIRLFAELKDLPIPAQAGDGGHNKGESATVFIPLRVKTPSGILSFFSTITVFGTPVEITLSEIALEAFYPADAATADTLRAMAASK
jgi:transcriptional regulator with XRE-family HTH domain